MKITKNNENYEAGIYKPDEKEQEFLGEVSDKIIDIMLEYNLTLEQELFLLHAIHRSISEANDVIGSKIYVGKNEEGRV